MDGDSMNITIRRLFKDNYEQYKVIRLELLQAEPTSFGSSFEEENLFEDEVWKNRLTKSTVATFGAFDDDTIVGICVVVCNPRKKMKHIASIHSMYVKEDYRKQGIAKMLLEKVETFAKSSGVDRLNLSVVSTNEIAKRVYQMIGFVEYGMEPEAILYEKKYYSLILMSKNLKGV